MEAGDARPAGVDFTPPDEALWPPRSINELGRRFSFSSRLVDTTRTTPPATTSGGDADDPDRADHGSDVEPTQEAEEARPTQPPSATTVRREVHE